MEIEKEQHLNYLRQIVTPELPCNGTIKAIGQDQASENYWCRITWPGNTELIEYPDVWVEDLDEDRIRRLTRQRISQRQKRQH